MVHKTKKMVWSKMGVAARIKIGGVAIYVPNGPK